MVGRIWGNVSVLDRCLTSVDDLASQLRTLHYLASPTEVLNCLKFPHLILIP